jgi:hypothetical protein
MSRRPAGAAATRLGYVARPVQIPAMMNEDSDVNISMYFSPDIGMMEQDPPQNVTANVAPPAVAPQPGTAFAATNYCGPIALETHAVQSSMLQLPVSGALQASSVQVPIVAMNFGSSLHGISIQSYQPRTDAMIIDPNSPSFTIAAQKRGSPLGDGGERNVDPNQRSAKKQSRGNNRTPASNKNK